MTINKNTTRLTGQVETCIVGQETLSGWVGLIIVVAFGGTIA